MMTSQQNDMIKQLEILLVRLGKSASIDWTESNSPESRGYLFGRLSGVTVTVAPNGLINLPAVRTYHPPEFPTPVIAAASADKLWARQKARDEANLKTAKKRITGHLGPLVGADLRCQNMVCPCHDESLEVRQKRAQGGFNTNPYLCS